MLPNSYPPPVEPLRPATVLYPDLEVEGGPIIAAGSGWWHRIGGGSLTISIIVHAIVILLAVLIVYQISVPAKEEIEFLPGGGGGGKGSEARIAQKQRAASLSAPKTRTISTAVNAEIGLPDISTSMSDFSALSAAATMGGGLGGGAGGLRGSGSGGPMGNGQGSGFGPGKGSGFVSMTKLFGTNIEAKRMAVILDISGSMYDFLPVVIKEVDKVAAGSMVILHYGCGLSTQEASPRVESTSSSSFSKDRITTRLLESKASAMSTEQKEAFLAMMKKRPKTYFVPQADKPHVGSTWVALTDEKLKDADAVYWFADFADPLNAGRMEEVARRMSGRKQKLYIHPSNPKWLDPKDADPASAEMAANIDKVSRLLVTPSGGKVIRQDVKKEVPVKDTKPKSKPDA